MSIGHELTMSEAVTALRAGDISAEALATDLIARADANVDLNAFVSLDKETILSSARQADLARRMGKRLGRLHGAPVCLKDNIDAVGYPITACSPGLAQNRPKSNAPVVASLLREGAVVFGKNTMHELAFGITCNNSAYGPVRNPYDGQMIPGGSSGGTAVAIAARLAPAGIGTDTGGSIRVPAALCGVMGLRPSIGRWPQKGIVPIASSKDTAGPMARSMDDLRLLDSVVTGEQDHFGEIDLRKIRIGVPRDYYWTDLDGSVDIECSKALERMAELGITFVDVVLSDMPSVNEAVGMAIALFEPGSVIPAYLNENGSDIKFDDVIRQIANSDVRSIMSGFKDVRNLPDASYLAAVRSHRPRLMRIFEDGFRYAEIDAIVFPTSPLPARPIGDDLTVELNGRQVPTFNTFIRNTDPGSNAGLPGVTLPVGVTPSGLPIGLAMDGPPGSDRRLLAIASKISECLSPISAPRVRSEAEVRTLGR